MHTADLRTRAPTWLPPSCSCRSAPQPPRPRQLRSLARLRQWLPSGSPAWIATAAGLGALRGDKLVNDGAELLASLDLAGLLEIPDDPSAPP